MRWDLPDAVRVNEEKTKGERWRESGEIKKGRYVFCPFCPFCHADVNIINFRSFLKNNSEQMRSKSFHCIKFMQMCHRNWQGWNIRKYTKYIYDKLKKRMDSFFDDSEEKEEPDSTDMELLKLIRSNPELKSVLLALSSKAS